MQMCQCRIMRLIVSCGDVTRIKSEWCLHQTAEKWIKLCDSKLCQNAREIQKAIRFRTLPFFIFIFSSFEAKRIFLVISCNSVNDHNTMRIFLNKLVSRSIFSTISVCFFSNTSGFLHFHICTTHDICLLVCIYIYIS